jgi:hypothetical protein
MLIEVVIDSDIAKYCDLRFEQPSIASTTISPSQALENYAACKLREIHRVALCSLGCNRRPSYRFSLRIILNITSLTLMT